MPRFVALLRGVNVGKAKRVPMADFRDLLTGLGYTRVATLLNSGNAVFDAAQGVPAEHGAAIAAAILARLKVQVPVVVVSAVDWAAIIEELPFEVDAAEHARCLVVFVQDSRSLPGLAAVEPILLPGERFAIGAHAAYLLCAAGILQSQAGAALLGTVAGPATTRNWATVHKLLALTVE